ncbi:RcnB family protein [Paracoccus aminophilus]|uniref:Uncharacterized protein n=1 Tax=Paracoccus aminophilus JCM 7686 TaxID=1367847 RepID=S5YV06_PARAH|nr:RcnB family protein [Paracoccus aminophilus]AGT09026.1 hypothetical protein JCM7686_1925 [Paracoccus aminophilus JCM 7686]
MVTRKLASLSVISASFLAIMAAPVLARENGPHLQPGECRTVYVDRRGKEVEQRSADHREVRCAPGHTKGPSYGPGHSKGEHHSKHSHQAPTKQGWKVGERYGGQGERVDYRKHHLSPPGKGQIWVKSGERFLLVNQKNGKIAAVAHLPRMR